MRECSKLQSEIPNKVDRIGLAYQSDFRCTPVNGHSQDRRACLKRANNGKEAALFDHPTREQSGRSMAVGNQVWGERS
jgi:hypothetical protein